MANVNDYLSAIRQRYPYVQIDDSLNTELKRRANEGATVDQVLNDSAGYSQTQPSFLKPLTQQDQQGFQTQAANEINPTFNAQRGLVNQDYTDLSSRLKENQNYARTGIMTNQANSGFLQTGGTNDQLAYQQRDTTNQLNRADLQRTLDNANLALQNAQAVSGRSNELYSNELGRRTGNFNFGANATSGLGGLGLQQTAQKQNYGLNQAQSLQGLAYNPMWQGLDSNIKRQILTSLGF